MMKKAISVLIILVIALTIFAACGKEDITLESMKKSLKDAGYEVYNEVYDIADQIENMTGGFTFVYKGAHGDMTIPVFEFKDKNAANDYAKDINTSSGGGQFAILNGKFLSVAEAHGGNPHQDEKEFLDKLLNGRSIK